MGLQIADAMLPLGEMKAHLLRDAPGVFGNVPLEFVAGAHHDFGGGRGRRRAQVGDEIGDGEIGFVADAGDDGNYGFGNRAGHRLFVESPQIFERASAAGQNQHVDSFDAVEIPQGLHDFHRRAGALHLYRKQADLGVGESALQHAQDVANGGAGRRGDHADAAGQNGQRFFAGRSEKAFFEQAFFELLEGELQRAEADRIDMGDVNLIFAARVVDAERTADGDVQTVFRFAFDSTHLIAEADAADLGARVFQGEVIMSRLRSAAVGDFAFHRNIRESAFEQFADAGGQLADFPGATLGH